MKKIILFTFVISLLFVACKNTEHKTDSEDDKKNESYTSDYKHVELSPDLSNLSVNDKEMVKIFIEISKYIDTMFFYEAYGNYTDFDTIKNEKLLERITHNFGPWDRFNENKPFVKNIKDKPLGANFYPSDITKEELVKSNMDSLQNRILLPYTFVRRDSSNNLYSIKYNNFFENYVSKISELLIKASELSENKDFANYLKLRADAILTDNYTESDLAWLKLKTNKLDFVVGPVTIYEDKLLNKKAEHQSYVLIKNNEWCNKTEKYDKWLPFLQKAIPVGEQYRKEEPGTHSNIYIYEAIYLGGSSTAGGIMLSLMQPLDSKIRLENGSRNLQFKNIIEYKFQEIAKPISELIIVKEQQKNIKKEAFFTNTVLYEIANSLGIRNTIDGKGTVREALKENFTISDILKNYVLSLFLAEKLYEVGEITNELEENYTTFVVNILRVLRFGITDNYAKANLICFNYFQENGAIEYSDNQTIKINFEKMKELTSQLTQIIITTQGDGDYQATADFFKKYGTISNELQKIINKTNTLNIPKDITLNQGVDVLGI